MSQITVDKNVLESLEYHIFPTKVIGDVARPEVYNQAYCYWRDFWKDFYLTSGSLETFNANEFFRQDVVACLIDKNKQIVGVHSYCFFDTQYIATRDHSYFALYNDLDFQRLKKGKFRKLMTMEYMTIRNEWRKSLIGISLAEVLVACAIKMMQEKELDASITIARADLKATEFCKRAGFETLRPNVVKHHISCDLMVCPALNPKQSLSPEVQHYMNHYWTRRNDFTNQTRKDTYQKQAA